MAEIIDKIDWKETEDVKPFFGVVYPFCDVIYFIERERVVRKLVHFILRMTN
jgi:hypothetical protein